MEPSTTVRGARRSGKKKDRPHIKRDVITQLWLNAGSRCSFPGCHAPVAWNPLTYSQANFAFVAHIVSWQHTGPRGNDPLPFNQRNDIPNLILLCGRCHKEIDDEKLKAKYTVETLRRYKREHEEQVAYLLSLLPQRRTTVLTFLANVNNETPTISFNQIFDAVKPWVPIDKDGIAIHLTNAPGQDLCDYYSTTSRTIEALLEQRLSPKLMNGEVAHLSVLAIGPIPLLIKLGHAISNKVETRFYQRHRSTDSWVWPENTPEGSFEFKLLRQGTDPLKVGLIIEVSGVVAATSLPHEIDESFFLYKLGLKGPVPSTIFLTNEKSLSAFKETYANAIATLVSTHLGLQEIHFFPTVPAPIAILCGRELLHKAHPRLKIYDFNKQREFFHFAMEVN